MKTINIFLLGVTLFICCGCPQKDDGIDCLDIDLVSSDIFIEIFNTEGISLIGEDNVYKPSEIMLFDDEGIGVDIFSSTFEGLTQLVIPLYILNSDENYILKLNDNEQEVVNITISVSDHECGIIYRPETFRVNNTIINQTEFNTYRIIK